MRFYFEPFEDLGEVFRRSRSEVDLICLIRHGLEILLIQFGEDVVSCDPFAAFSKMIQCALQAGILAGLLCQCRHAFVRSSILHYDGRFTVHG